MSVSSLPELSLFLFPLLFALIFTWTRNITHLTSIPQGADGDLNEPPPGSPTPPPVSAVAAAAAATAKALAAKTKID